MRRSLDGFYRFFERFQRVTKTSFFDLTTSPKKTDFDAGGEFLDAVAVLRTRFLECMDDDFNSGGAVGVLNELLTTLNRFADARRLENEAPSGQIIEEFGRAAGVLRENWLVCLDSSRHR